MKIKIRKQPNKAIFIVVGILLIVGILATSAYAYFNSQSEQNDPTLINDVDYDAPSDDQIQAGEDIKKGSVDDDGGEPANANNVTITAKENDGTLLRIRTLVGAVSSTGTCDLTLEKDGVTVTRSALTQPLASNSTCKGFDIPVSELSSGVWDLTIEVTINNETSTVVDKVTI